MFSGIARGAGGGLPRAARLGGGILDKLYVIIFLSYYDQLLLGYIPYLLIVNHLTVLPRRKVTEITPAISFTLWCILREYKKDLILICIMLQLCTVFFFVFASFESLTLSMRMQYRH